MPPASFPKTYSRVEESTADFGEDGDIDGQGEAKCQTDVEQLREVDVARVSAVVSMRGVGVGNLGRRQCHQQEQERSHELSRELDGVGPQLREETIWRHGR